MPIYREIKQDFFKIWSPEMAYILGLFAADGNIIRNKRGAYFISLEICDREILEKISFVLQSTHSIGIRKGRENHSIRYRLQIGSKKMAQDLYNLGFTSNKTFNMSLPNVPEKYFSSFVRGYFDGDGNVWSGLINKKRSHPVKSLRACFTSSSRIFLLGLKKRLEDYQIIGGSFLNCYTFYRLNYSSRNSLRIYDLMYNCEHYNLYLKRKKDVFDNFIALRP